MLRLEELVLLGICVYHEARGEPFEGQVAVAQVVLDRAVERGQSVREVIFAPMQFSWANGGVRPPIRDYEAFQTAMRAAVTAVRRRRRGDNFESADHYFADYIPVPRWAGAMTFVRKIGRHLFYRDKGVPSEAKQ